MTTNQSASLAVHGEVKRGHRHMEPKAPLTGGEEAPTARSKFFTIAFFSNRMRAASGLMLTLALSGCTIGPDYQRPDVPLPATFKQMDGWIQAQPVEPLADDRWWTRYRDADLDALIDQIDAANQTLAQAEARYRQALALIASARAERFPTLNTQVSATRSGSAGAVSERYNTNVGLSWLPDLWGRVQRNEQASRADAQASAADLAGVRLAAQSALAQAYFRIRVIDQQQELLAGTMQAYERSLTLTRNQYEAGLAARADVVLAETQLAQVQVQHQDLQWQRAQQEHAIAVLIGKTPADLSLPRDTRVPSLPPLPELVPASLLTRRPDVAAAERAMAAANARIGVAQAAWIPDLTISASGGFQGGLFTNWLTAPYRVWSLGPALAATLFDGGARAAGVDRAMASYDEQVARYRQTVLNAIREVEDALALLRVLDTEAAQQRQGVALAVENETLVANRYQAGIVTYLEVAVAQNTTLNARRTLLSVEGTRLDASVQLLGAMGGGWDGEINKKTF